jgi:hypothetical protein
MYRPDRTELMYGLVAAVVAIAWSLATPVWQGPDEPSHYAMVQWMGHRGSLPVFRRSFGFSSELKVSLAVNDFERIRFHPDEKVRPRKTAVPESGDPFRFSEEEAGNAVATYPPLYYGPAILVEKFGSALAIETRLRIARLANLPWAFLFGFFAFRAARRIFNDRRAHAIALGAVLLPQTSFMSGVLSPDIALNALYAFVFDAALRTVRDGRLSRPLICGLVCGSGLWIKQTAAWAPATLFLIAAVVTLRSAHGAKTPHLKAIGVFSSVTGAVAAPWFIHCFITYGSLNPWVYRASTHLSFMECVRLYLTLTSPSAQFAQFLGRFGWLDARLPFALEAAAAVTMATGTAWTLARHPRDPRVLVALVVGIGGILFTAAGLISSGMQSGFLFAPIGRYYCAYAPALIALAAIGPLERVSDNVFARAASAAILFFSLYAFFYVLVPRYHG